MKYFLPRGFLVSFNSALLAIILSFAVSADAQNNNVSIIHLKAGDLHAAANAAGWLDSVAAAGMPGPAEVLMQFDRALTRGEKERLARDGVEVIDYMPVNTYVALVQLPVMADDIKTLPVRSITGMDWHWKADNYLWNKISAAPSASVEVFVSFYHAGDSEHIKQLISGLGAQVDSSYMQHYGFYKVIVAANKVANIAQWHGTRFINPVSQNVLLDLEAKAAEKINLVSQPSGLGGYRLLGDSVVIGVGDNVSGIYHIDQKDRIINYNPSIITHHGEHIGGIVGSAGIIDPLAEGVAPHATMVDHLFDAILAYTGLMHDTYNMTATNNSYAIIEGSCDYSGTYDAYSVFVDQLALQYKDVTHVFAAGNDGLLTCSPFPDGFATIAGGYQPAKNNIVVTSTDKNLVNAIDGSRGPVKDGRLKPEVSAVGVGVYSDIDIDGYEPASGTSMASPQVAGTAGLLAQQYRIDHGNANPPSDLLKTVIMNGATDIGNPGPDYRYGYGFLNAKRSVDMMHNGQYVIDSLGDGETKTFTITVPANTAQAKVMLYWHDDAASPLAASELVNDLDITVQEPGGTVHQPLILDTAAANIENNAVEGDDHLNNSEQVTINTPVAGTYTVTIKGYHVPSGMQRFVVAYDYVPSGITLAFPTIGSQVPTQRPLYIYWDASNNPNTFKLEFSSDNGASWSVVADGLDSTHRYYEWSPPAVSSGKCLMRLTRNGTGEQYTTGLFNASPEPVLALDTAQCPGYINMHWAPVPNASIYHIWRKKGFYMQVVDSTTDTTYLFSGLTTDSMYYVSVDAVVDGLPGYRAIALKRQPNDGSCSFTASFGDLSIDSIIGPRNGRQLTSTQLGSSETLSLVARDHYSAACSNYRVYYQLDGGAWQTFATPPAIPANGTTVVNVDGLDLSATGNHNIVVAIRNITTTDPVASNDTVRFVVRNIVNSPIDLSSVFTDDFETMPVEAILRDSTGVSPNGHWDYANSSPDSGRMRSFVNDSILIGGARSISLDAAIIVNEGNQNHFTGTFNLGAYDTASAEVRLEFDYKMAGKPKYTDGNMVSVRGADTKTWAPVFYYDSTLAPGVVGNSGSISVTDGLLSQGENFSTSMQVDFGQHDTSLIALNNYGNGLTIDNFKLYTVANDAALVSVVSPLQVNCGLGAATPLVVRVHNGVNYTLNHVYLFYQLDGGAIVEDSLNSIGAKNTVDFTFGTTMDASAFGGHTLKVWLTTAGDTYHKNDSILNYSFHNEPLVTVFPYLENFEGGDGYWFTDGVGDTWQYGTPAAPKIHKAASGVKAWKTNLTGVYNPNSINYLYSPCFDISGLTNPMLSFSTAMDIENCGSTLCDAGFMEYSYDGVTWTKLGAYGQGTNWYDSTFNIWNKENNTRWHVASIPLPVSTQPIRLRYVVTSDPGGNFEGMAVDDVHIFDRKYPIYEGTTNATVFQDASGSAWVDYVSGGQILVELLPGVPDIGNVDASIYVHDTLTNPNGTQYTFPRNYALVKAADVGTDTTGVRLFLTDKDFLAVYNDTTCKGCSKPQDAYSLGITKYDNSNVATIDGTLADNDSTGYTYYPYNMVKWVPYDAGYYAEIRVGNFSEFWFNDGWLTHNFAAGIDYLLFDAFRISANNAEGTWTSRIDTIVNTYELQRSYDDSVFTTINTQAAMHHAVQNYSYTDAPTVSVGDTIYYRLKWVMMDSSIHYSNTKEIVWDAISKSPVSIYPNPSRYNFVNVRWYANQGAKMQVEITDALGKRVYQAETVATQYMNQTTLQTGRLAHGIYFIKLIIDGKTYIQKISFE